MTRYDRKALGEDFYRWWSHLHDAPHNGKNANRKELAELRRLDTISIGYKRELDLVGALCIEAFRNLHQIVAARLGPLTPIDEENLLIVAAALARIRTSSGVGAKTAARLSGREDQGVHFNQARFIRLIRTSDACDLFDQARRLCALLKNKAPVTDLALSLFFWRQDPKVRQAWAAQYYNLVEEPAATTSKQP